MLKWTTIILGATLLLMGMAALFFSQVVNPAMMREVQTNPLGEEGQEVMLLTFGEKTLPVNYLKEGNTVFIGVDGRWWRAFTDNGAPVSTPVSMLIQGETYQGHAVVVLDNQAYTNGVFLRLRPTAPEWLPLWLTGKLVVITIDDSTNPSQTGPGKS